MFSTKMRKLNHYDYGKIKKAKFIKIPNGFLELNSSINEVIKLVFTRGKIIEPFAIKSLNNKSINDSDIANACKKLKNNYSSIIKLCDKIDEKIKSISNNEYVESTKEQIKFVIDICDLVDADEYSVYALSHFKAHRENDVFLGAEYDKCEQLCLNNDELFDKINHISNNIIKLVKLQMHGSTINESTFNIDTDNNLIDYINNQYNELSESAGSNGLYNRYRQEKAKTGIKETQTIIDSLEKSKSGIKSKYRLATTDEKIGVAKSLIKDQERDVKHFEHRQDDKHWVPDNDSDKQRRIEYMKKRTDLDKTIMDSIMRQKKRKLQNENVEVNNMTNNEKLATLLVEAAELLTEETTPSSSEGAHETLHEGINGWLIAIMAMYWGATILTTAMLNHDQEKAKAKTAKSINRDDMKNAIKFFNDTPDKIRTLLKSSKYKEFLENGVISIRTKTFEDVSDMRKYRHKAFNIFYPIVTLNMYKIVSKSENYDAASVTENRYKEFIKDEIEKVAKMADKIRNILHVNKFVKENFNVILVQTGDATFTMYIAAKQPLVFDSSKYLNS